MPPALGTIRVGSILARRDNNYLDVNSNKKPTMIETVKVCTLIASRGLVHTRTMESVLANLENLELYPGPHPILFSHDKGIPDAQNDLVERALLTDATHFWFVEEDNTFPPETLFRMLAEQMPVVAVDYPVGAKAYSTIMEKKGEIWWCGLGCTLIDREVFADLRYPWFRTDKTWRITDAETMELVEENIPNKYGGHDINFGMELRRVGIPIVAVSGLVSGHLEVIKLPDRHDTNKGTIQIVEHNQIRNYQRY